jgi:hypothetical protein
VRDRTQIHALGVVKWCTSLSQAILPTCRMTPPKKIERSLKKTISHRDNERFHRSHTQTPAGQAQPRRRPAKSTHTYTCTHNTSANHASDVPGVNTADVLIILPRAASRRSSPCLGGPTVADNKPPTVFYEPQIRSSSARRSLLTDQLQTPPTHKRHGIGCLI